MPDWRREEVLVVARTEIFPDGAWHGFVESDLTDAYNAWKAALAKAPYSVTKSEKDPHDAEVNFSSAQNTGQARLGEECQGRRSVTITIRPK